MICSYLKTKEKVVHFLFQNVFLVVHIPFVLLVKFQLLAQFPVDHLAPLSCLFLNTFCANLQHSLIMWSIVSSPSSHKLRLLFCCIWSIFCCEIIKLLGVLRCWYQKRFSLSLKAYFIALSIFSRVRFCLFNNWNIQTVVFSPFLFSGYFCSVDTWVVCIDSSCCKHYSLSLLLLLLLLLLLYVCFSPQVLLIVS